MKPLCDYSVPVINAVNHIDDWFTKSNLSKKDYVTALAFLLKKHKKK